MSRTRLTVEAATGRVRWAIAGSRVTVSAEGYGWGKCKGWCWKNLSSCPWNYNVFCNSHGQGY